MPLGRRLTSGKRTVALFFFGWLLLRGQRVVAEGDPALEVLAEHPIRVEVRRAHLETAERPRRAFHIAGHDSTRVAFCVSIRLRFHRSPVLGADATLGLVRRELRLMMGSFPFLRCDVFLGWSGEVYAVDASKRGGGLCRSELHSDLVAECGRYNEHWRF